MSYLLGGGGGGVGAPLDGGGGGGGGLPPLGGFPEDFAPPESKNNMSTSFKISYLLLNKRPSSPREEPEKRREEPVKQNSTPNTD